MMTKQPSDPAASYWSGVARDGVLPARRASGSAVSPASPPRRSTTDPLVSQTLDDALVPGVMVELDAAAAEAAGAFEETALSEADAWDANADLIGIEGWTDGRE
jgi:type IV secretion system protein VirB1